MKTEQRHFTELSAEQFLTVAHKWEIEENVKLWGLTVHET